VDQRGRQARYVEASLEKALGVLPVVADYCRRLDLAGIIDRACPVRDLAHLSHGQVIEALIANRLTSPVPLVRVSQWAEQWAVEEVFGIAAERLNDDRIGRALDAIAPELDAIIGSVGAQAISAFGLDVSRLHWDMTSISLFGQYEETEPDFIAPRFGHPKDRRPDLKQVQTGLAVAADGGIPLWHRAYDGGAGEVAQVVGAMTALKAMAIPPAFLLVGDSKLVSYANLAAMCQANVAFIAPASKKYVDAEAFAALDVSAATPVDYLAGRDVGKAPGQRGSYRVSEDAMDLAGKRRSDPAFERPVGARDFVDRGLTPLGPAENSQRRSRSEEIGDGFARTDLNGLAQGRDAPGDRDRAGMNPTIARDQVEQRRLADAVSSDEACPFGTEAEIEAGEEGAAVRRAKGETGESDGRRKHGSSCRQSGSALRSG